MSSNQPILECVPNFSEGRDQRKIQAIAAAIRSVSGSHLMHIDTSPAANRTVMTFAGSPEAVISAAFEGIRKAAEVIDMRMQEGVHPRIGATDVCPLVPLHNMKMSDAVLFADSLAERVGRELGIPVYLYEYSAKQDYRRALPDIRKGQYEGLHARMTLPEWKPDFGPVQFMPATGATVVGARDILVAFNISLDTKDTDKAVYIAERLRERGFVKTEDGERVKVPGTLTKVRAIGWYMQDYECAQVSMNLLDYRITSPLKVWETCKALAEEMGVTLAGSEVIGLIPETCLLEAGTFVFMKQGRMPPVDKEMLVHTAIEYMGLNKVKPFDPQSKILEYALRHAGL